MYLRGILVSFIYGKENRHQSSLFSTKVLAWIVWEKVYVSITLNVFRD